MTILLVAAAGGHLKQLHTVRPRLTLPDDDVLWATFDTPQSRSLLDGEDVVWARYPRPHDVRVNAANALLAARALRRRRVSTAVSTGSSIAVSFFAVARARGATCHYIESATRVTGPSLTGRILRRMPGVRLYSQHERWAKPPWRYRGSIFDGFEAVPAAAVPRERPLRIVVTVGSSESYGFRRLVEHVRAVVPQDADVLWQTGDTDVSGLDVHARRWIPAAELEAAILNADVVIAHAGTGSSLVCLEAGKLPILVPRRKARGEHVDDHQVEIASMLSERGLALWREADAIVMADIERAAAMAVRRATRPPAFTLD